MKVTSVNLKKIDNQENLKAFATIILYDSLAIHNLKLIQGNNGLFIAFPNYKGSNDKYYDIVHPIVGNLRREIETEIINSYNK